MSYVVDAITRKNVGHLRVSALLHFESGVQVVAVTVVYIWSVFLFIACSNHPLDQLLIKA